MRVLFDQGTPVPCGIVCRTTRSRQLTKEGGATVKNGDLLAQAEAEGFDALITTDQNLRHQQNLSQRRIAVIVLLTTSWPRIKNNISLVAQTIDNLRPGSYEEISFP